MMRRCATAAACSRRSRGRASPRPRTLLRVGPERAPHPELVLLDWELYPVDELDADRHAGALAAMEEAEEAVNASAPIYNEGPVMAAPELCEGAPNGVLADDFLVWSDGPYSYSDYVFRGVAKAAKLVEPPIGYRDL